MEKKLKYLANNKNLYQLQVGSMMVEFNYSKNDKSIDECLLNILKRKNKIS